MNSIAGQPNGQQFLDLAGPGFRDFSRIAASDPKVWRDICLANKTELLEQSRQFQQALQHFDQLITSGDAQALEQSIAQASTLRADWHMTTHKPTH